MEVIGIPPALITLAMIFAQSNHLDNPTVGVTGVVFVLLFFSPSPNVLVSEEDSVFLQCSLKSGFFNKSLKR